EAVRGGRGRSAADDRQVVPARARHVRLGQLEVQRRVVCVAHPALGQRGVAPDVAQGHRSADRKARLAGAGCGKRSLDTLRRRRMQRVLNVLGAALALAAALVTLPAQAQGYPSKAMRLVSPFPPGGSVDVVGRLLAAKLSESLGQQMVVDNRSGASGVIGPAVVMNSPPDGYTLLINTIPFVSNQFLMPRAPYDPLRDFVAISLVASSPSLVTVHPSLPARSIQELVALAKAKPGQLFYSAACVGTNPHIAGELFNLLADVNIVAVQFKGGGPADTALIAGEVAVTFGQT